MNRLTADEQTAALTARRIFANRDVALDRVRVVGFDMDHTLAEWHRRRSEALAYELAVERLIERGYPEELRRVPYDPEFGSRGLALDGVHGNILKMNAFLEVRRAYHGTRLLLPDETAALYPRKPERAHFQQLVWMDTLFSLPEVFLYAVLVDLIDAVRPAPDYARARDDVRECIDTAHRDGSMKGAMLADLGAYLNDDPHLPAALGRLRDAGKRLFLLTNSPYPFTDAVMGRLLNDRDPRLPHWRDWFNIVVVSADKPGFFTAARALVPLDDQGKPGAPAPAPGGGRCFEGGNLRDFEALLDAKGDDVLYVGDHIYGDILRPKRESGWRTCMVIPELEDELAALLRGRSRLRRLHRIESTLALEEPALGALYGRCGTGSDDAACAADIGARLAGIGRLFDEAQRLEEEAELAARPYWGAIMKAGNELSRFGAQVRDFACLYTSRASNFALYPAGRRFVGPPEVLPHERAVELLIDAESPSA